MQILKVGSRVSSHFRDSAILAMRTDGIVLLRSAVSLSSVYQLNTKMQADLDMWQLEESKSRKDNPWASLRPPPFAPFLFRDIVFNTHAIDVCRELLGPCWVVSGVELVSRGCRTCLGGEKFRGRGALFFGFVGCGID